MKIIRNPFIPFRGFKAISLFGVIFIRKDIGIVEEQLVTHEYIHTLQQREMLYVFFYIWYLLEWIIRLIQYRNAKKAYRNISFEREAYFFQHYANYPNVRKKYSWWFYLVQGNNQ